MDKLEELEKRIEKLENAVFHYDVERCPRCGWMGMNYFQNGVCIHCAYKKGDPI